MTEAENRPLPPETESWFSEHPEADRNDLEQVWKLSELADEPFDPDERRVAEMRDNINHRISTTESSPLRLIWSSRPVRVAASVALLVATGAALWLRPIVKTAPLGATATFILPDESSVSLNSGSSIKYGRTFGWASRSVSIQGEAYFDVTKADSEFEISTFNGRIAVLGTQFNVRAWSDDIRPETRVHVDEGVVRFVATAVPDEPVIVDAGHWSTISAHSAATAPHPIFSPEYPIWKAGGMAFSDRPLHDVLKEIGRRFDVEVLVASDSLMNVRVSLHVSSATDIGTILEMVAGVHDLDIQRTDLGFELAAK